LSYGVDKKIKRLMMEKEKLISEYNEAKFQIFRLHNLWLQSKYLREHGNLVGCKWVLDSATIELWNDAERLDEDKEKKEEFYVSILENLDKKIMEAEKAKDKELFYFTLLRKEKLLREIQEKSGKGARWRPADEDYM